MCKYNKMYSQLIILLYLKHTHDIHELRVLQNRVDFIQI